MHWNRSMTLASTTILSWFCNISFNNVIVGHFTWNVAFNRFWLCRTWCSIIPSVHKDEIFGIRVFSWTEYFLKEKTKFTENLDNRTTWWFCFPFIYLLFFLFYFFPWHCLIPIQLFYITSRHSSCFFFFFQYNFLFYQQKLLPVKSSSFSLLAVLSLDFSPNE